ncbi:DUF6881 domain-containing protein [Rugosimonospora africana]|uniref:DUF6881 domain-containing protein n=1 Tax=Rugosimonospora africana TaxID=556532 RepID=A0A8J3R0L4_9ACTN|nr:hypothetical protein [Rugosimonospora africana]GIH19457.1 hypothetical protein Raf01_76290 [Rugosimonospora africana]
MKYIKVLWHHDCPEDPIELYSEVGDDGWEVRKIELYRDGRYGRASSEGSTASTGLSDERVPDISEIAALEEFTPNEISAAEFEAVWQNAQRGPR